MFEKLFEKGKIGSMTLRNRIVMPPMLSCFAENGGFITDRLIEYLAARAKGGAALIIPELAIINPMGFLVPNMIAVYDDKFIPGLEKLVNAIHSHDAKIALQIGHAGSRALSQVIGAQPVSCSPVAGFEGEMPRELAIDEIKKIVDDFKAAAIRVKQAGVDGIEIHCAHGYLIRQFLSPYSNKRTDEYGGDLRGRAKFAIDIVTGARQALGNSYPLWFRINGRDFVDEGEFTLEDSKIVSGWLVEAGADAVSVSASTYESKTNMSSAPMFIPRGQLLPFAEAIKKTVSVPVIAAGRINMPDFAEQVLREGKADFVAMGRTLIADPDLPIKAQQGRIDEIRRCIACNECIDRIGQDSLQCTVNAAVGKESEYESKPVAKPRKVWVIGGGPAGMEAARTASLRGHHVTLFEREERLGGQVNAAAKGPYKEDLNAFINYLECQMKKAGVSVELQKELIPESIEEHPADVVIIATGARPFIPSISGIGNKNVVTAYDVLLGKADTGKMVVVIGGGRVGVEVAEFLIGRNKDVTIVEMLPRIGNDMNRSVRAPTLRRLKKLGIKTLCPAKAKEIVNGNIVVDRDGYDTKLTADTIVLAMGAQSNDELVKSLKSRFILYAIGDCVKPRNILDAVAEGAKVGRAI